MIEQPRTVPPIGKPKWEVGFQHIVWDWTLRSGIQVQRRSWANVQGEFSGGAYWVRYWDWFVSVEAFGLIVQLWHFVERVPNGEA